MLAQGSPFALTNLSISAGYFPDDDSITISLNIGADVNFIDVIGQLVSNVCLTGLRPDIYISRLLDVSMCNTRLRYAFIGMKEAPCGVVLAVYSFICLHCIAHSKNILFGLLDKPRLVIGGYSRAANQCHWRRRRGSGDHWRAAHVV
jgi:hypothetical protein